jgi:toxin ParE1/3/4
LRRELNDIRIIGFERRVAIAFRVMPDRVQIVRIFYGGRDAERLLREAD